MTTPITPPSNPFFAVARFMHSSGQITDGPERADVAALYLNLVREELTELAEAIDQGDIEAEADAIADSLWVLMGYGWARGFNMIGVWDEVTRSNMAKIGPDGTVQKDGNGKVIKPEGWTPPDLARFL